MKIVVITRNDLGTASVFLDSYINELSVGSQDMFSIDLVVKVSPKKRKFKSRLRKIKRIGLGGALVGLYLRRFYNVANFDRSYQSLKVLCLKHNLPYCEYSSYADPALIELMTLNSFDYGLSLGNDIMPDSLLLIPRYGFLNVHHELLPDFPNAQSVIWSIYHKRNYTGLTLHKMTSRIDEGDILYQENIQITKGESLVDCIRINYENLVSRTYDVFVKFIDSDSQYLNDGIEVEKHTTPSFRQFMSIVSRWGQIDYEED